MGANTACLLYEILGIKKIFIGLRRRIYFADKKTLVKNI